MKLASMILLTALCGCMNTAITSGGPIAPKKYCIYSNATYQEVEYQLTDLLCALTAIQMNTNRAAEISDKALADYWQWQEKSQKRYDDRRK
ncbi:MAG: hypothetical protein WC455_25080 [Dehalococcoidia bacterium]|jgi:hypothetical protein